MISIWLVCSEDTRHLAMILLQTLIVLRKVKPFLISPMLPVMIPGHYYGWLHYEGTFEIRLEIPRDRLLPLTNPVNQTDITWSIAQYDHDEGRAI
ncbi:MAG: hypothetical protein HKN87_05515 [Saprospiraceae bacterium]|nr:hypothetical protein [Saprospiraceae bacterium]